jgi:glutathione S-transferase
MGVEPLPDQQRMTGYGSYAHVLDTLEQAVDDREHLAGDRFSAADLYVGSHLIWGMGFGTIEKRPAFVAYTDRLRQRPAAVRAAEIDDALIPARQPA